MLNSCHIQGRFTKDPELRTTQSEISVVSFTLANDQGYGEKKNVEFIEFTAWRQKAEFIQRNFHKGDMAIASGTLKSREWTDRDGGKRKTWFVELNEIEFCGSAAKKNPGTDQYGPQFEEIEDDDDIPF